MVIFLYYQILISRIRGNFWHFFLKICICVQSHLDFDNIKKNSPSCKAVIKGVFDRPYYGCDNLLCHENDNWFANDWPLRF